jgi:hypothetical protein
MSNKSNATVATMGIDIGKNSFHVVGLDQRGAIVLRQKWSRGQIEARLANIAPCLIGMEASNRRPSPRSDHASYLDHWQPRSSPRPRMRNARPISCTACRPLPLLKPTQFDQVTKR